MTCARWRTATLQPILGNLPTDRVTPSRPFQRTGVDCAGSIRLRAARGHRQRAYKAYIAIFICFSMKVVHIEVVLNYTTDAFLAAFCRFTARCGLCEKIYLDCGTNFIGANRELKAFFQISSAEGRRIADAVANKGVQRCFNPPSASHFGGLGSCRQISQTPFPLHHRSTLTFEVMSTLLSQVKTCLNYRPLPLSDDPTDVAALTPGHFLTGAPLFVIPESSMEDASVGLPARWRYLQKLRDQF